MLQMIRDQVKGWIAVVIFTIMIVPFAFWGINYYFEQSGGIIAIEVNDEEITLAEFQRAYQDLRAQWQSVSGAPVREEAEALLKQQTTESLIQSELMAQAGKQAGLYVGDEDAWRIIRQVPAFNDDEGFNLALFEVAANQSGLTPAGFMGRLKRDLAIEQLRGALSASEFVTETEVAGYSGLLYQTRDLSYTLLSADELKQSIEPTQEEIESYYAQEDRFMEPERVRIGYLVLSLAKIAEEVYLEDGELEAYFEDNRQNYEVAQTRKVKQILVRLPEDAAPEKMAEMSAKADELYELVMQGADWEDVVVNNAGQYEEAIEFSEFGFLTQGALEPEVDEVVFAMEVEGISEPVQSGIGFHIMSVDEIQAETTATLEARRAEVEQDLRQEKAAQQLYELTDRLATLTYENPDTLDIAAEELGLQIQTSDYLTREDPGAGIVAEPAVIAAAFSEEALLEDNNSELLELDDDRYMVLRVLDHLDSFKSPLAEVRGEIVTRLKFEQARDSLRDKGETILERLRQGTSKQALAGEFALGWITASDVTQDDESVNRAVLRAAFRAGVPEADQAVYDGLSLGTGDYAVAIVHAVDRADPDSIDDEQLNSVRGQLLQTRAASTWAGFNEDLRADADITVYEESL